MEESVFEQTIIDFLSNFKSCEISQCSQVLSIDNFLELFVSSTGFIIEADKLHALLIKLEFKSEMIDNKLLYPIF